MFLVIVFGVFEFLFLIGLFYINNFFFCFLIVFFGNLWKNMVVLILNFMNMLYVGRLIFKLMLCLFDIFCINIKYVG